MGASPYGLLRLNHIHCFITKSCSFIRITLFSSSVATVFFGSIILTSVMAIASQSVSLIFILPSFSLIHQRNKSNLLKYSVRWRHPAALNSPVVLSSTCHQSWEATVSCSVLQPPVISLISYFMTALLPESVPPADPEWAQSLLTSYL